MWQKVIVVVCSWTVLLPSFVMAHENPGATVIHMDENGFSPEEITVRVGETIIFENTGSELHWPASDDHPSHTNYNHTSTEEHCAPGAEAGFDACEGIAPGQSWSFNPDRQGTFSYHDHLWSQFEGTLHVRSKNWFARVIDWLKNLFTFRVPDEELMGAINVTQLEFLKEKYITLVQEQDPRVAIETLEKESERNSEVLAVCHDILHQIGSAAYEKYTLEHALSYQKEFCNSGYVHGVFESHFKVAQNPLEDIAKICRAYTSQGETFETWQCYHGIGHGLMYYTGGDLDKSLELCVGMDESGEESCRNGAYMELFNAEPLAKEEALIGDDPFDVCAAHDVGKGDCYVYVPTYFVQTKQMSYEEVIKGCAKAGEYVRTCVYGVGSEVMKRNMSDVNRVFALCGGLREEEKVACIEGAVSMYMNQKGSYEAGEELCKNIPDRYQSACGRSLQGARKMFAQ